MKNLLKIGALSLALVGIVFMMNTHAADTGELKLKINGTSGSCTYGTKLDLGDTGFQYDAYIWTGQFITTTGDVGNNQWNCTDSAGVATWALTVGSTDLINTTTNVTAHTIASTRVHITSSAVTNVSGFITSFSGLNASNETLDTAKVVIAKISALGDAGRLATDSVKLSVDITGSQAIGQYSGTLTVNVPSL